MVALHEQTPEAELNFEDFNWSSPRIFRLQQMGNVVPAEFETKLAELKEKLLTMASFAEAAVDRAVKALVRRDDELARRAHAEDDQIDRLEVEIDQDALRLLTCRPALPELRFVTMAMKIASNLERVGDEATTISRRVIELSHEPQLEPSAEIQRMAALSLRMLKEALDAFVQRDPRKARAVIPRDREVDDMNERLHLELALLMEERPATIIRALSLMFICKSLERIADHAANVAEEVVYLCEGRDIRHLNPAEAGIAPLSQPTQTR